VVNFYVCNGISEGFCLLFDDRCIVKPNLANIGRYVKKQILELTNISGELKKSNLLKIKVMAKQVQVVTD